MIIMGLMMIVIWTRDILFHPEVDISKGFFRARDKDGGIFWYHWLAEYLTATSLVVGGLGFMFSWEFSLPVSLFGLGALFYTSLNSLSWAMAEKSRYVYAIPMSVGLIGAIVSFLFIVVKVV